MTHFHAGFGNELLSLTKTAGNPLRKVGKRVARRFGFGDTTPPPSQILKKKAQDARPSEEEMAATRARMAKDPVFAPDWSPPKPAPSMAAPKPAAPKNPTPAPIAPTPKPVQATPKPQQQGRSKKQYLDDVMKM